MIRLCSVSQIEKAARRPLDFARAFCVTTHDLDSVGVDLAVVVELEIDVFDDEGPDIVTEAVGVEVSLERSIRRHRAVDWSAPTLKVKRALTLSASTSATALSKFARILMASWGSMRRSVMSVSSVSVRAPPTLRLSAPAVLSGAGESTPAAAVQLVVLGRFGGHGDGTDIRVVCGQQRVVLGQRRWWWKSAGSATGVGFVRASRGLSTCSERRKRGV